MSRHTSLFSFLESVSIQLSPPRSPSFHPHSFVSEIRSVLGGCSRFRRCCYLISVLSSHRFCGSWAPGLSRSHLDSAVELSCAESKLSRPRRASLFGYCAMVRTPLRLPTTDVATPPTFEPRQPPLVSWHFFLLVLQSSVPISADHCLLQKAPECSVLPAPSSFARYRSPSLLIFFCGSLSPRFLRPGRNPKKLPTSRLFGNRYGSSIVRTYVSAIWLPTPF